MPSLTSTLSCLTSLYLYLYLIMLYNRTEGGGTMKVGQEPAKKKPSGMSRAAKNTHNAYQRNYTKNHRQAKREANKRYWEKKTNGG